jgi:hypothetical protein
MRYLPQLNNRNPSKYILKHRTPDIAMNENRIIIDASSDRVLGEVN